MGQPSLGIDSKTLSGDYTIRNTDYKTDSINSQKHWGENELVNKIFSGVDPQI